MPVAFASDDNSTLDNNIENLNDKTTYENMKSLETLLMMILQM